MTRTLKLAALALAAVLLFAAVAAPADAPLRSRRFQFDYSAKLNDVPANAGKVEVWIPYPQSDEHQVISDVHVDAPVKTEVVNDPATGNSMVHFVVDKPQQPVAFGLRFAVDRREYVNKDFPRSGGQSGGTVRPAVGGEIARWLKPDKLVPLSERIRTLSGQVTAGKTTDLEKARAIYDYVVQVMSYDKSGTGWGNGDIYWACDAKRGNCTDFHALFIGLARAAGIPAKFEIGFPVPPEKGKGEVGGYHCWAEFYLTGYGWVPVDASEAKKHLEKKDYFFGALDENRVQLTVGRDLHLTPRQAGEPLNYFVYPYVEIDGKPYSGVTKKFSYQDLDTPAAPSR